MIDPNAPAAAPTPPALEAAKPDPAVGKPPNTKQKIKNAATVLTGLYSELENVEQLAARCPTIRADALNHILSARDGLLRAQDLLKED